MELDLSAQFQEMDRIYPWLQKAAEFYQIPESTISRIHLCLEEIVLNIIKYGYEASPSTEGSIQIRLEAKPVHTVLEITDNARSFNPIAHEAKKTPLSLDEAEVGGLGIELVRSFSESMNYERRGDSNWLRVVFRTDDN